MLNTPETTVKERQNRLISIRPNGKIRPIPSKTRKAKENNPSELEEVDTETQIFFEPIQHGNIMANFQGEYELGHYFKAKNIDEILKSNYPINPLTRTPLNRSRIQTYTASLNGNMSRPLVPAPNFDTLYPEVISSQPQQSQVPLNVNIRFRTMTGQNYNTIIPNRATISLIVERFGELKGEDEIMNYIHFVGIPNSTAENDLLLKPFLTLSKQNPNRVLTEDLTKTFSEFNPYDETNIDIFVRSSVSYSGILSLTFKTPNSFKNLEEVTNRLNLRNKWVNISNELVSFVRNKFRTWLSQHPSDFNTYKYGIFTPGIITYAETLKKEAQEILNKKIKEVVDEYRNVEPSYPRYPSNTNRRNRRTRRNHNSRKNRRS